MQNGSQFSVKSNTLTQPVVTPRLPLRFRQASIGHKALCPMALCPISGMNGSTNRQRRRQCHNLILRAQTGRLGASNVNESPVSVYMYKCFEATCKPRGTGAAELIGRVTRLGGETLHI